MNKRYVRSNAIFCCRWLTAAALALFSLTAQAAYTSASAPEGWSKTPAANAQLQSFLNDSIKKAGASTTYINKKHTVSVAGRAVQATSGFLLKNAEAMGKVAKTLSKNPWGQAVFYAGGAVCATGLCEHMISEGLEWIDGQGWSQTVDEFVPFEKNCVQTNHANHSRTCFLTMSLAIDAVSRLLRESGYKTIEVSDRINAGAGFYYQQVRGYAPNLPNVTVSVDSSRVQCPVTYQVVDGICGSFDGKPRQLTADEFEQLVPEWAPYFDPRPWPEPLPVSDPVFNPDPANPEKPTPLYVPTGEPSVKETDNGDGTATRTTTTPGVEITGAPTSGDPFRVDIKPKDEQTTDRIRRDPETGEVIVIESGKPEQKPPEDAKGLCDQYPDILACAQVPEASEPDQDQIEKEEEVITYEPENLFSGGSCPADVYVDVGGRSTLVWNWTRTCSYAHSYARPLILLLATITAVGIVIRRA